MLVTTALLLTLTTAAPAVDLDTARAKQAFQWAERLYKQARYAEAIDKFEESYRLKPHPAMLFNIGRCYEQLSDIPRALKTYHEYLKALPNAKDKELVTDAIVNLERRLKEQGVQQVMVYSDPPGASVAIDGKACGGAPAAMELHPGNHTVVIAKEGYDTVERAFVMPADRSSELSFSLKVAAPIAANPPSPAVEPARPPPPPPPPPPLVVVETRKPEVVATAAPVPGLRSKAWIPAVGGAALLATGGVFYGLAKGAEGRLRSGDPALANPADRATLASSGRTQQTVAFVAGGVGVAALAAAATMFFWPSSAGQSGVGVVVTPSMGAVVFSGELP